MDITINKTTSLKDNEAQALMKFKEILLKKYNPLDLKLFGSKARGVGVLDSDVDVFIELEDLTIENEEEIDRIVFEINLEYKCFISAIIFTKREIKEGPLSESPLYKNIQYEGIDI